MSKYSTFFTVIGILLLQGCATPNALEKDSKVAWEGTKEVSKDVWHGTKKVSNDVWNGGKKVVHDVNN